MAEFLQNSDHTQSLSQDHGSPQKTLQDTPRQQQSMSIGLTGATGFVGAALADLLLEQGHHLSVLVRNPARLHRREGVRVVEGDLSDPQVLQNFVQGQDHIIHCAGLTHARRNEEFYEVNVDGARQLAEVFADQCGDANDGTDGENKFIHISSLAARQPEISTYARSKFQSEQAIIDGLSGRAKHIILRAPAMFGPRDTATLPFFKAVKNGLAPVPASKSPTRASILFVDDFARAVLTALYHAPADKLYEVGDNQPDGHSWDEIAYACATAQKVKARTLSLPHSVLWAYAASTSALIRATGRSPMVTPEKIAEFFHPDWAARENLLKDATDWHPKIPLKEGFARTALWYQQQGLL